jgi:hypothetical protein
MFFGGSGITPLTATLFPFIAFTSGAALFSGNKFGEVRICKEVVMETHKIQVPAVISAIPAQLIVTGTHIPALFSDESVSLERCQVLEPSEHR